MRIMFGVSNYAQQRKTAAAAEQQKQQTQLATAQEQANTKASQALSAKIKAIKPSLTKTNVLPAIGKECPAMTRMMLLQELQGLHYQPRIVAADGMDNRGFFFLDEHLQHQGFSLSDIAKMKPHISEMSTIGLLQAVTGEFQGRNFPDNPSELRGYVLTEFGQAVVDSIKK